MGAFWITFGLFSIIITAWESTAITNKRWPQQGGPVRNFRHIAGPSSANIHTDWEVGLREATAQALLREGYQEPNLRDRILEAPLIGRQDTATPFGDIAVLARGQLYVAHGGNFAFVQDQYHNDCDDCHNARRRCVRSQCEIWKAHQNERLVALWTVKRLRHRDYNNNHRYELEYTISPISASISEGFVTRNGHFDYAIPGHVFVVKTGEKQLAEPHPTVIYNRKIPHRHFKPEVLIGVSPDGHKHILHSYPGFYTSFPVHPTYHQKGYSTNDPKEIELYKALIESLAAKTSTTQKVENGPHRFSLNHYGDLPTPNKVYSTKPSYDSFLSPQTPLVQFSTSQVVPLTDITPVTNTPTYVPIKLPTTVYQPTNPMVLNMVATKPMDLNTQEVNPPTEGLHPSTVPEVTQPIKTTFHYFTPVDDHLLTTDEVNEMRMSFQTTATTKETTAEYHKPSAEKPTSTIQEDEAGFLFPIAEKSTTPSKTTEKADKPTYTSEGDFLFPIEPVTAPSKVTKKYHSTITTDYEHRLTSSTRKTSTPKSTTISTPKLTTIKHTTQKPTTLGVTTPKLVTSKTSASKTTKAKATDSVIITTKTPTIIRPKTTTKIARPKTTTNRITTLKSATTKTTTLKLTTITTPKSTTSTTTTSTTTTSTTTVPTTRNRTTTQKFTTNITTPKSTTTEITTASSRMTEPEPTTTKITTPNPTTIKTTTPKSFTTKIITPTRTKTTTSTTTEIPTQTTTVMYPTTRFTQQTTLQEEEMEDSEYSILPKIAPTKPMEAMTLTPLEERSESNNQLQPPAQNTDTTLPFSTTITGTQQTQKSTKYEVKTTETDQTTTLSNTLKTTVAPTEETTSGITTKTTQDQTKAVEETTENDRETTLLVTARKQIDLTAIPMTTALPPTLKMFTTTQEHPTTIKTPETTGITKTMLEKHVTTTEADSEPTTTYQTISQSNKPTTKMSTTIRTKPTSTTADDFLTGNGKIKIPSITKPMNTDYDEDDIFGSIETSTKPTKATTRKITESELAGELFGNRRRQVKLDTTEAEGTKIIFANFFQASTTPMAQITDLDTTAVTTELYKTTLDLRPLTSQSYSTSISFEVNKKNKTDLVDNVEYVPAIMATVREVMNDNEGYTVYKAELPPETSTVMTEAMTTNPNTKKAFDYAALQLVNHARSIDYLSMNNKNRTIKSKYKRRRNYVPKNRRMNVKRKN